MVRMKDKAAMLSLIDSMAFTLIVGIILVNYCIPSPNGSDNTPDDIGSYHEELLSIRVPVGEFYPDLGERVLTLPELIVIEISRGCTSNLGAFIGNSISAIIGPYQSYGITFEYSGSVWHLGEEVAGADDYYQDEWEWITPNGMTLRSTLIILL